MSVTVQTSFTAATLLAFVNRSYVLSGRFDRTVPATMYRRFIKGPVASGATPAELSTTESMMFVVPVAAVGGWSWWSARRTTKRDDTARVDEFDLLAQMAHHRVLKHPS